MNLDQLPRYVLLIALRRILVECDAMEATLNANGKASINAEYEAFGLAHWIIDQIRKAVKGDG